MHALWNLSAVTIGISSLPIETSPPSAVTGASGVAGILLIVLAVISALGLVLAWGRLPQTEPDRN